ncbi:MAG: NAD-dependent epimerase/dehydratase family protein [Candidatus Riflebacteria bacterium]|nr:NAD-dependent epimerase/dehydratase family protein [Candidatus Riflebacteria bacterium]
MNNQIKELVTGQIALVTGGSGFLGRAIVKQLLDKGLNVRILCRSDYPDLIEAGCTIFRGEVSDAELVDKAVQGCDLIFHTAAKAGVEEPYSEYERINYQGTLNILNACRKNQVSRLIYTSSPSVVFSHGDVEGRDESMPYPDHYDAYYPKTKGMAEKEVLKSNSDKLATVALRPHLIWGPGDNHLGPRLVSRARAGRLKFVGDGKNKIDTVYIDNAADAHILAAERLFIGSQVAGKAYFITNSDPRPISEITNLIIGAAGCAPVTATISPRIAWFIGYTCEVLYKTLNIKGEPPITRWVAGELSTAHWFNISAARNDLGYEPRVSIEEGIKRLREYYKEQ